MIMTALTGCGGTDSGNNNATQDNATTVNNDSVDNADNAQEPADAAPEGDDAAASIIGSKHLIGNIAAVYQYARTCLPCRSSHDTILVARNGLGKVKGGR